MLVIVDAGGRNRSSHCIAPHRMTIDRNEMHKSDQGWDGLVSGVSKTIS